MSTPADYKRWCEVVGLNPFHPEGWTDSERRSYARWRLGLFRAAWKGYADTGQANLIRQQSGRAALINHVKADLAEARRPLARNPWTACPCHPRRVGMGKPDVEPYQEKEDYPEGLPAQARVLRWLRTEFSGPKRP